MPPNGWGGAGGGATATGVIRVGGAGGRTSSITASPVGRAGGGGAGGPAPGTQVQEVPEVLQLLPLVDHQVRITIPMQVVLTQVVEVDQMAVQWDQK